MQRVLGNLYLNGCVVYIDDIVINSKNEEEHEILLRKVFQKIREAGLKLRPTKCRFFKRRSSALAMWCPQKASPGTPARQQLCPLGSMLFQDVPLKFIVHQLMLCWTRMTSQKSVSSSTLIRVEQQQAQYVTVPNVRTHSMITCAPFP